MSDGDAGEWLQAEFPHLHYRELPSYDIRYSAGNRQWPKLALSLPHIAKTASAERQILKQWVEELEPAGIISDNRLGFHHPAVPSVYLSHQLSPKAGMFSNLAGSVHRSYYRKFNELWVPDELDSQLSGGLSATKLKKRNIGLLSALKTEDSDRHQVLMILSGPEPQRSVLEQKLFEQADALPPGSILVRGKNGSCPDRFLQKFKVYDRLGSYDLSRLIAGAEVVISRSGYSSLMDYRRLAKKAILVPTPGQYEQEYLGKLHHQQNGWITVKQSQLNLEKDLQDLTELSAPSPHPSALPEDLFRIFSA